MKTAVLLLMLTAALFGGCTFRRVSEQELLGKYQVDLPDGGIESLELLSGGDCIQIIRLKGGTIYEARGTWEYNETKRHLLFRGLRGALASSHEINPGVANILPGVVGTDVFRTATGNPIIYLSEDLYYRKVR